MKNFRPTFKMFVVLCVLAYLLAGLFYVFLWHTIVNMPVSPSMGGLSGSSPDTNQQLNVEASVDVKIYRYGFLPVYWSRIGDLTAYHLTYFTVSTAVLCLIVAISYYKRYKHEETIQLKWGG